MKDDQEKRGFEDFIDIIEELTCRMSKHHHSHRRMKKSENYCDDLAWKSKLMTGYGVSVVLTVNLKGCADFSSVQKAMDAVPNLSPTRTLIIVDSGTYREKVTVCATKTNLIIQGQDYLNTTINDTANSTGGTPFSYTIAILSTNFVTYNISFQNTAPPLSPNAIGAQAVALSILDDKAAFCGCGFYEAHDALNDDSGRHYFKECFIQGSIKLIFGNGRSLYKDWVINSIAKEVSI
ncbi:probable pectinesterase 15 [Coffea arabica]|uniref:pectinesterase n=1 Tax=Coffea arabica TaxID=13443 RepID=A0ABM4VGR8_COFAR